MIEPNRLNRLVRTALIAWLAVVVALPCLWTFCVHIVPFALAGFSLSNHHGILLTQSMAKGALWLIPSSFLVMLYWWTRPGNHGMWQG
jgi:hypothetical protein